MEIEIGPAKVQELDGVLGVLDDAAAWLQSIGVTEQWPPSVSALPGMRDQTRRDIETGAIIVARKEGKILGVFRLDESDETTWPGAAPEDALYLHSLAVKRAAAGGQVAGRMLAWARVAAAARGRYELRLDCWSGNERLKRYYLEHGFSFRGERRMESEDGRSYSVARFAIRSTAPS